jgi:hypothetical protein
VGTDKFQLGNRYFYNDYSLPSYYWFSKNGEIIFRFESNINFDVTYKLCNEYLIIKQSDTIHMYTDCYKKLNIGIDGPLSDGDWGRCAYFHITSKYLYHRINDTIVVYNHDLIIIDTICTSIQYILYYNNYVLILHDYEKEDYKNILSRNVVCTLYDAELGVAYKTTVRKNFRRVAKFTVDNSKVQLYSIAGARIYIGLNFDLPN